MTATTDPVRAVLEQAGREPWRVGEVGDMVYAHDPAPRAAIVHAVNGWEQDQARIRVAREALEAIQWSGAMLGCKERVHTCPSCRGLKDRHPAHKHKTPGHQPGCQIRAALAALDEGGK